MAALVLNPPGVLFKGSFITPNGGDYNGAFTSFDFNGEWKSRIDVAKSLGFNCVEFICSVDAPTSIGLAIYLARLKQVLDYCASIGMYVCIIASPYIGSYVVSVATAIPILIAVIALLSSYPIGISAALSDESVQTSGFAHATDAVNEYIAVKAAPSTPTNFPVSCSSFFVTAGNTEWADIQGYATAQDFFLCNLNIGTPSGSAWTSLRGAFPSNQLFFNVGYAKGGGDDGFTTNFPAQNIVGMQNVVGSIVFTQEDFGAGTEQYGLYTGINTGPKAVRLTPTLAAYGNNPIVPATRTSRGSPVKNQYLVEGY